MKYIKSLMFVLAIVTSNFLVAQVEDSIIPPQKVEIIARYIDGNVELRWFPVSAAIWRLGNKKGYILERTEIVENGKDVWEKISPKPILPLSAEEWKRYDMGNDYIRATARAINEPLPPPQRGAKMKERLKYQNDEEGIFIFFSIATDMNADASMGAGLRFIDKTVVAGKSYAYQIRINEDKVLQENDFDLVLIDTKQPYQAPIPLGLRMEESDHNVKLYWEAIRNRDKFSVFHVERSVDNRQFERITKLPIYLAQRDASEYRFVDSIPNYQQYYYRIVGITPFGDEGKPSESVKGMAKDFTPAMGATNIKAQGNRKSIEVTWKLAYTSADLKGFYVGRSTSPEGPFNVLNTEILPPSARSFRDANPAVFEPYYIVYSVDEAGNRSHAFAALATVVDHDPPAQPLGLTGKVDTNGIVSIHWERNTEEDLLGYHIYMANGKNDVYRQLTRHPIRLTDFQDTVTMKALNKKIYYKITALDYNNNPSPYSKILTVKRPDIIPPAAPSIYKYDVGEEQVTLTWHNSSSDDIKEHTLFRQKEGETAVVELLNYRKGNKSKFTDTTVQMGASYTYTLSAEDEAGNVTVSSPLSLSVYDHGRRPEVENLRIELDKSTKMARLSWTYDQPSGQFRFVVFKGMENQPLSSYKSTGAEKKEYRDFIKREGVYQYAVKVIYADGGESKLSEPVRLKVSK